MPPALEHHRHGFLSLKPPRGGLQRLGVALAAPDANHDAILAQLSSAGLTWSRAGTERFLVIGGTRTFETDGIRGYEQAFAIKAEPPGRFTIAVAGTRGFPDLEQQVGTLRAAVEAVVATYRQRALLPSPSVR